MSALACAATASIASVGLLPALSRIANAVTAAALALCVVQPAAAQQRTATFVVPYSGTLKKIHDSGIVRIGHRQSSPPFAFLDKNGEADRVLARSVRDRRRRDHRGGLARTFESSTGR